MDGEDNVFPVRSLTNGSSSESESSYEEEDEDSSGTENRCKLWGSGWARYKRKEETTIKHKKQKIKREACQSPNVLNNPFAETPIDMDLDEYSDPTAFFRNFFIDESLQYICDESNKYGVQTNPNKPLLLTKNELTIHRDIINDLYHQNTECKELLEAWNLQL